MVKMISMPIFISGLPEPGNCTGKSLRPIALLDRSNGSTYQLFEITFKPKSYPTSIDEGTTVVIISGMNVCYFKSCPLDTPRNPIWWNPYLCSKTASRYTDILRAQLPKSTYSNSCVWPAGLVCSL